MYSKEKILEFLDSLKEDMKDKMYDTPKFKYYSTVQGYERGCRSMLAVLQSYRDCVEEEWE